ncbi:aldehyde dehydrogenase family protein [Streptomyces sp. NPDC001393]
MPDTVSGGTSAGWRGGCRARCCWSAPCASPGGRRGLAAGSARCAQATAWTRPHRQPLGLGSAAGAGARLHPHRPGRRRHDRSPGRPACRPRTGTGVFVPPTLFTGVTGNIRIATEEIFGPVATVTAFSSQDEAVEIANESDYGLQTGVYSRDSATAFQVARPLQVGMVFVNNCFRGVLGTPFGGTKHGGYGREHAIGILCEFAYPKMIRLPTGLAPHSAMAIPSPTSTVPELRRLRDAISGVSSLTPSRKAMCSTKRSGKTPDQYSPSGWQLTAL